MSGQTVILDRPENRALARLLVSNAPQGAVVHIKEADKDRTKAQNRLVHKWFGEIASQMVGQTAEEVKAECNLTYGRPILGVEDDEWNAAFGYIFDALSYPAKLKAIRVLDIPFTRRMTVKQLTKYMDQMYRDYTEQGVRLTTPEGA